MRFVSAKFRNIMMTNSVIPDFIVDELYVFFPAPASGPDDPAEENGSGQADDPGRNGDSANSVAAAGSAACAPVCASGVPLAGAEEPDSSDAGCLWGTFRRVDAGAVVLDIATFDMVRFRYGCPVPEHLSLIRRATRDEIRDFFYSLGRAEQMLGK